jgi:DNA-binding SARP family transcriptional activator
MNGAVVTGDPRLRISVLGPLLVERDGAAITLPRGRAGVLLAVLAMSAGRPVGAGRLSGLIWDTSQPAHSRASLHTVAARLRGLVPGAVVTSGDGYLLDVEPDDVDLLRFRRLVRRAGEAGDPASALAPLERALGLWRGEPLADLRSAALDRDVVPGLTDEYLAAAQQRADLELAAGQHDRVIAELRELVGQYPLREPLWGQLMRALAAAGRQAEAVGEYHRVRETLAAELGLDPSPGLQDLYGRLLQAGQRAGPATTPRSRPADRGPNGDETASGLPRRLPADTGVFTGREAELSHLLEVSEAAGGGPGPGAVVVVAIDGMAGVGKTALAVHAAHRLATRFSDGQLFIDLHGYTQGYPPRTPDQVLEAFLRAMGVSPQAVPADTEERAALYRQRLAGTRTLILLDNAADEAQVRPLIPGDAGCLVLVTSRRKLKALDDAHVVAVDVMPEPDAVALLRTVAGPRRAPGEQGAAEVVGLCGRLPLAVRIAGALLRNRPAWTLAHLAEKLRTAHSGLDAFSDGDRDLAGVFGLSDQNLRDDQRRLFRYLGLMPGPETDAYAAAALADTGPVAAERLLQELVDDNLLLEPAAGRYQLHDLIRAHARALAPADPAAERDAARGRLLDYYQHTALRADARIARYTQPGPDGPAPRHAPALPDQDTARAWLRAERVNLAACLRYAVDGGLDARVVALSAGLANLLRIDGPWPKAAAAQATAVAAAERLGDKAGQARARAELGNVYAATNDYPRAQENLRAALKLHRETGDEAGQAYALTMLSNVQRLLEDRPGAEASLREALALHTKTGDKAGRAHTLIRLGMVQSINADWPGAKASQRAALELHRESGDKTGQAHALTQLIHVQCQTGDYEDAIRDSKSSLVIIQELGDRLHLANALSKLGMAERLTGDYGNAAGHQQAAVDMFREVGNRLGQGNALTELAEVRRLTGDREGAARDLEEAAAIFRGLGSRGSLGWSLNYYAAVIADTGDHARATRVYHEALRLAREVRQPDDEAIALQGLGELHLRAGELEDGAACLHQALQIYRRLGMPAAGQVTKRLAAIGAW